jgi:hypothetical protein
MTFRWRIALACALWSGSLAAQAPVADPEDQVICIGGPRWAASLAENAAVESEPVPASLRELLEGDYPCVEIEQNEFRLINWQVRFGTERSTTQALEYVERRYLGDIPPPERYLDELSRAWRGAQVGLADARAVYAPQGEERVRAFRLAKANLSLQEFERLQESREEYVALADQFLRAAEEFGSRDLLGEAKRYVGAAVSGFAFLAELESQRPESDDLVSFDLGNRFLTDDVEMRAAVLTAELSRTELAMARAEAIVRRNGQPSYEDIADHAFTSGGDFCDIDDDFDEGDELETACEAMDAPHEQVLNYMRSRAILDLVTGNGDPDGWNSTYASAMRLLAAERQDEESSDRSRCCRYSTEEDLLRLRLARAHYHQRLYRTSDPQDRETGRLEFALRELKAAERLAAPFTAPGRFQRIAGAWLDGRQEGKAWQREQGEERAEDPTDAQYAAYLERTLAQLDAIAQGQGVDATAPAR